MIWMSRVSKKKLIKILKGEYETPTWTRESTWEYLKKPLSHEEWLKGSRKWKKDHEDAKN